MTCMSKLGDNYKVTLDFFIMATIGILDRNLGFIFRIFS
jgi:hypothetical protein